MRREPRLLSLALVACGCLCFASSTEASNVTPCEPGALCVDLDPAWLKRTPRSDAVEVDLPTAHEIAAHCYSQHKSQQRQPQPGGGTAPRFIIARRDLSSLIAPSVGRRRLRVSTGPRHDLAGHPDDDARAEASESGLLHLAGEPVRCETTGPADHLPSVRAAARFCPAGAPAVIVQDAKYSRVGLSMTCAFCPATHLFASVTTVGPAPVLDILLPVNSSGELSVHLIVEVLEGDDSEFACQLKCNQDARCINFEQVCDGVPDCAASAAANSSLDEDSTFCPFVRYERSRRVKFATLLAVGASVTFAAVITAAAAVSLAVRHWLRSKAAVKLTDHHSLSLVDKAPLI